MAESEIFASPNSEKEGLSSDVRGRLAASAEDAQRAIRRLQEVLAQRDPAPAFKTMRVTLFTSIVGPVLAFLGGSFAAIVMFRQPLDGSQLWFFGSIALACFLLGIGLAYLPFSWYQESQRELLRRDYAELRKHVEAATLQKPSDFDASQTSSSIESLFAEVRMTSGPQQEETYQSVSQPSQRSSE